MTWQSASCEACIFSANHWYQARQLFSYELAGVNDQAHWKPQAADLTCLQGLVASSSAWRYGASRQTSQSQQHHLLLQYQHVTLPLYKISSITSSLELKQPLNAQLRTFLNHTAA